MTAKNAIISVFDKTGIDEFAASLVKLGWTIYASGGTAEVLQKSGVPVTDTSKLVKGGSILGHRVVTLSREIAAGILATDSSEDLQELKSLGIPYIDLVCVDMYPLVQAINDPKATETSVTEQTDIGGPLLLRAAAKGRRITLCKSAQRQLVIDWLSSGQKNEKLFRRQLAAAAELEVARYVCTSAEYLADNAVIGLAGHRVISTRHGENPWQEADGLYSDGRSDDPLAITAFNLRSGSALSYTNITDVDRLLQTATHIAAGFDANYKSVPYIGLSVKHGNVCGTAVADDPTTAIKNMIDGDPRAIFGGAVMLNFKVDEAVADLLLAYNMESGRRLLDVVIAADVSEEAIALLQRKEGKLRIVTNPALATLTIDSLDTHRRFRYVRGGFLAQQNYTFILRSDSEDLICHGLKATKAQQKDMLLAWAIGTTSNSNTITLVRDGMLLGNGVGQQDRVSAAQLSVKRAHDAGHITEGAVAYSDSFFPFPDGPETLASAGITTILSTRGSVKDEVVFESMRQAGVAFYTVSDTKARGFFGH